MNARLKIQFLILRKVFLKIIVIAIIDKRKPILQFHLLMSCPHTPVIKMNINYNMLSRSVFDGLIIVCSIMNVKIME